MCFLQNSQMKQTPLKKEAQHIHAPHSTKHKIQNAHMSSMHETTHRTYKTVCAIIKPIIQSVNQTLVSTIKSLCRISSACFFCFCFWFIRFDIFILVFVKTHTHRQECFVYFCACQPGFMWRSHKNPMRSRSFDF